MLHLSCRSCLRRIQPQLFAPRKPVCSPAIHKIRITFSSGDASETKINEHPGRLEVAKDYNALSQTPYGALDILENNKKDLEKATVPTSDVGQMDHLNVKPKLLNTSYHLASYVNQSDTLSKLLELGVDLSKLEKHRNAAEFLLKSDFVADIQPYLMFLTDNGVPAEGLGDVINKNPWLFEESIDNMSVRIAYLESKRFTSEMILNIILRAPRVLNLNTKSIDTQLGFLQNEFKLTGVEVRTVVTRVPKLITWKKEEVKHNKTLMREFLGFTEGEMKQILLSQPKIYVTNPHAIQTRFDYLHNQMGLTHVQILSWPEVLRTRVLTIRPRHMFLQHISRAQYDPTKENFVTLKELVSGRDAEFCRNVAKTPVKQYNEFLKTL